MVIQCLIRLENMISETDLKHFRRCIELAKTALEKGNETFGSVLVTVDGPVPELAGQVRRLHHHFFALKSTQGNLK